MTAAISFPTSLQIFSLLAKVAFICLSRFSFAASSSSILLISILFILLAANVNLEDMKLVYNWDTALLFAIIVFVIRPLGVFISSMGSDLNVREKMFIGWVGPRGIVAAGIASLFGSSLVARGEPGAEYITPLVFTVVLGTVLLNATTARYVAQLVGVFLKKSEGILIIGASRVSRLIAQYLQKNNRHVVLIDSNASNVEKARNRGLEALVSDIYSDTLTDNIELSDVGYLMALTPNADINKFAIEKFRTQFGENGSFRVVDGDEMSDPDNNPKEGLFSHTDDFIKLIETSRRYPSIHEIDLKDQQHYEGLIEMTKADEDMIPIFLKDPQGDLKIISSFSTEFQDITEGYKLVYLGKKFDVKAHAG